MAKMTKMRKLAQGKNCTLRIPDVCNGDPATTVLCHAPYPNRGGMRNADFFGAFGCSSCHDFVDGRRGNSEYNSIAIDIFGSIEAIWMPAIKETQDQFIKEGLIKV